MKKIGMYVVILSIVLYSIVSWYKIVTTFAPDFSVYYGAATLMRQGKPIFGSTPDLFTAFNYPPVTAALFMPISVFPYQLAQAVWVTISFLLIPVSVWLSLKLMREVVEVKEGVERLTEILLWSCVWFMSFPTKFTLGMGQINIVSICLLLAGAVALNRKKNSLAAVWFIFLLVSKPQFLLLIPFLLIGGYESVGIGMLMGYVLLMLSTGMIFGGQYLQQYITTQIPDFVKFSGRDIYYNQSVSGFFSRVVSLNLAEKLTRIVTIGVIGGCGVIGVVRRKNKNISIVGVLSVFLPVLVLVEPLGWQHHLVFILPVYMWLWKRYKKQWNYRVVLICSYLLISMNIRSPEAFTSSFILRGTVLSHAFWGVVLVVVLTGITEIKKWKVSRQ